MIGFISGIISGLITGLGVGGGAVLIVILSYVTTYSQSSLQSINLIYYIPVAFFSLLVYGRGRKINYQATSRIILYGIGPAVICAILANKMDVEILKKFFATYLVIMGIKFCLPGGKQNYGKNNNYLGNY